MQQQGVWRGGEGRGGGWKGGGGREGRYCEVYVPLATCNMTITQTTFDNGLCGTLAVVVLCS